MVSTESPIQALATTTLSAPTLVTARTPTPVGTLATHTAGDTTEVAECSKFIKIQFFLPAVYVCFNQNQVYIDHFK